MDDQRQAPRFPITFRSVFLSAKTVRGEGMVLDLSVRGCRVRAAIAVQVNESFRLQLYLPQSLPPLQIEEARVRWVTEQEFGCQFITVLPAERARLLEIVRELERDTREP